MDVQEHTGAVVVTAARYDAITAALAGPASPDPAVTELLSRPRRIVVEV